MGSIFSKRSVEHWSLFAILAMAVITTAAVSCGDDDDDDDSSYDDDDADDDDDDDASGDVFDVTIVDMDVDPDPVTISVGDTVRWTNNDDVPHSATSGTPDSPDGVFDSGTLETGEAFSHTFTSAGTFVYFCEIHPEMMKDYQVIVN